ncbi:hypothetical protein H0H93_015005 [Arthromyces matolae]|nr:hypothetical protein H0H93_015005 [Arthromyces matolae]
MALNSNDPSWNTGSSGIPFKAPAIPFSQASRPHRFSNLSTASEADLINAGNNAYILLYRAYDRLEAEIKPLREEVLHLRGVTNTLISRRTGSIRTPKASNHLPSTSSRLAKLDIPKCKDHDDYPDVPFWTKSKWSSHVEHRKDRGNTVNRLGFLTDESGVEVDRDRIKKMTDVAKTLWNGLHEEKMAPPRWGKKTDIAQAYFYKHMLTEFSEFLLANDHWKIETFATIKYPDWTKPSSGHSTSSTRRKNEEDHGKAKKRRCHESAKEIIEITDNENDSKGSSAAAAPNAPIAPPPTIPTPSIASTTPSIATTTPSTDSTTPSIASTTPSIALTTPSIASTTTVPDSSHSSPNSLPTLGKVPTSSNASSRGTPDEDMSMSSSPTTVSGPPNLTSPPAASSSIMHVSASTTTSASSESPDRASPAQANSLTSSPITVSDSPALTPLLINRPENLLPASALPPRRALNPLKNLQIPPPPTSAPLKTVSPSTASAVVVKKSNGKPLKVKEGVTTARNLYLLDYLTAHPDYAGTEGQFSVIWKNSAPAIKTKYEELSKAHRKRATHTTTSMD